jgi:hypothetical protein
MAANDTKDPQEKKKGIFVEAKEAEAFDRNLRHLQKVVTEAIRDQRESSEDLELALKETIDLFKVRFWGASPGPGKKKRRSRNG